MKTGRDEAGFLFRFAEVGDESYIADIQMKAWRETYQGIISKAFLDSLDRDERISFWKDLINYIPARSSILVVETHGRMIGFCSSGAAHGSEDKFLGEIYAIYLSGEFHGKGLGKELFIGMMNLMQEKGFKKVCLYVMKENPFRGFYEKMGGVLTKEVMTELGGEEYPECVYTWDLSSS